MSKTAPMPPNPFDPVQPEQDTTGDLPRQLVPICQPRAAISEVQEPNPALDNIPLGQPTTPQQITQPRPAIAQMKDEGPCPSIPWETDPGTNIVRGNG